MTKKEHIDYWYQSSERDWKAVQHLYVSKDYVHALFFSHLVLEKICKALWVKYNEDNIPPRTHNLVKLVKETKVFCTSEQLDFMLIMNNFQLEGRYPDYKQRIFRTYKSKNTKEILDQVKIFRLWLRKQLLKT